jgi:hypothetical protein
LWAEFLDADAINRRVIARTEKALAGGPLPNQFDSGLGGEYLQGYTPGAQPLDIKPGQAKLIKAGSIILFQLHYTSSGKAAATRPVWPYFCQAATHRKTAHHQRAELRFRYPDPWWTTIRTSRARV